MDLFFAILMPLQLGHPLIEYSSSRERGKIVCLKKITIVVVKSIIILVAIIVVVIIVVVIIIIVVVNIIVISAKNVVANTIEAHFLVSFLLFPIVN